MRRCYGPNMLSRLKNPTTNERLAKHDQPPVQSSDLHSTESILELQVTLVEFKKELIHLKKQNGSHSMIEYYATKYNDLKQTLLKDGGMEQFVKEIDESEGVDELFEKVKELKRLQEEQ